MGHVGGECKGLEECKVYEGRVVEGKTFSMNQAICIFAAFAIWAF